MSYNEEHGITPQQIVKSTKSIINQKEETETNAYSGPESVEIAADPIVQYMSKENLEKTIEKTKKAMQKAAKEMDFLQAAQYRDEMYKLQELLKEKK